MLYVELNCLLGKRGGGKAQKIKELGRFDAYVFIKSGNIKDLEVNKIMFTHLDKTKRAFRLTDGLVVINKKITKKIVLDGKARWNRNN